MTSDFETLMNMDTQYALLMVLGWGLASVLAGRHPARQWQRGPRLRPVVQALAVLAGTAFLVVRTVIDARMADLRGMLLVSDRFVVALPVVGIPAVAALVFAGPALWREIRTPTAEHRLASFHPRAVVPVFGGLTGALVAFSGTIFVPLAPPLLSPASTIFLVDAAVLGLAWWWQSGRYRRAAGAEQYRRRRWWVRTLRGLGVTAAVLVLVVGSLVVASVTSRLPSDLTMAHEHASGAQPVSVTALTSSEVSGTPDVRLTLTAAPMTVRLSSGKEFQAWAFNGQVPGPEIRVKQDQLVEITVRDEIPDTPISVHWHGLDVPNAMDGVPGVTQDAIKPGGQYVYRFRAHELGTHWYHSHEASSKQVKKGLFGAFIVDPAAAESPAPAQDWFIAQHTWYTGKTYDPTYVGPEVTSAFNTSDQEDRRTVAPGGLVRLRLLNTDSLTKNFTVTGVPFRVVAWDGTPVNAPTDITDQKLVLGSGGRYDVEFTMPDHPVRVAEIRAADGGILITPDGTGDQAAHTDVPNFDPTSYGAPASTPFGAGSHFAREYQMLLDNELGFYDGHFTFKWTINGEVFPDIPPLVVHQGDLVKVTFANRSHYDHPMHLHGHQVLVLSHNGHPVTGSPLWLDTVTVRVGETWVIAFKADNPGIWMDHCHIFEHAGEGMMTHLVYEGVSSPYHFGSGTPNQPE